MRHLPPLLALLLTAACAQPAEGDGPLAPYYLQLDAYTSVVSADNHLDGLLHWQYLADHPEEYSAPRAYCEIWEELDLDRYNPGTACPGCETAWDGVATVRADETECLGVDWTQRELALGFAPTDSLDGSWSEEGYSHAVLVNWSPDTGDTDTLSPLFAALPATWTSDDATVGAEGAEPDGEYELHGLFWWDLQEQEAE